jgi:acylphosphatase
MSKSVFHTEVFFSGHVQGVGFRYQTLQVAKEFDVAGTVGNLPDGRVQLCAEGEEKTVRAFVDELRDRMSPFIRDAEIHTHQGPPQRRGFTIV